MWKFLFSFWVSLAVLRGPKVALLAIFSQPEWWLNVRPQDDVLTPCNAKDVLAHPMELGDLQLHWRGPRVSHMQGICLNLIFSPAPGLTLSIRKLTPLCINMKVLSMSLVHSTVSSTLISLASLDWPVTAPPENWSTCWMNSLESLIKLRRWVFVIVYCEHVHSPCILHDEISILFFKWSKFMF